MTIFDVISLMGGLAMFLYGMRLMGNSLKENSSGTLKNAMSRVTNNPVKAFILGVLITALIQSSTATIVITSGLAGAGILTLHQSLGIIIGANVGTTVTGQIIRLLDLNASGTSPLRFFQPSTLAPLALIIGIIFIMGNFRNSRSIGNIAIGFGILFSGLLNMTAAVNTLAESETVMNLFAGLGDKPVLGYFTGAGVAFVLQSSSATVGILQAFSKTGMLSFKAIYSIICGIYLGDCVTTAIVCWIGANSEAKRVGVVNILFNLSKTVLILVAVNILHSAGLLDFIWERAVDSGIIANTNTIFNLCCSLVLLPVIGVYERMSRRIVKDEPKPEDRYAKEIEGLNPVFFNTPAIALQSCYNTLLTVFDLAKLNLERSFALITSFDAKVRDEVFKTEDDIDRLCDALGLYMVQLQPYITADQTAVILNQYYKVVTDFERLGDHAVNIVRHSENMAKNKSKLTGAALDELRVLNEAELKVLDEADLTFEKRDLEAAGRIEPLVQVIDEIITRIRQNHFVRMGRGECDMVSDSIFRDLLIDYHRIAASCSNVGVATVVRAHPELADHEHSYYENLPKGDNETFNHEYELAYNRYFTRIKKES